MILEVHFNERLPVGNSTARWPMARAAVDGPKGPYNVDKGTTIQEVTTGIAFTRDGRNFKVPWSQVALIETETPVRRKVRRDAREGADE